MSNHQQLTKLNSVSVIKQSVLFQTHHSQWEEIVNIQALAPFQGTEIHKQVTSCIKLPISLHMYSIVNYL
jgi:hypothetical protein